MLSPVHSKSAFFAHHIAEMRAILVIRLLVSPFYSCVFCDVEAWVSSNSSPSQKTLESVFILKEQKSRERAESAAENALSIFFGRAVLEGMYVCMCVHIYIYIYISFFTYF